MDQRHETPTPAAPPAADDAQPLVPQDDDERFIVGLVLTYYRRHPQRARTRLLDLLGEVLMPTSPPGATPSPTRVPARRSASGNAAAAAPGTVPSDEAHDLWARSQQGVAPLKRKG
jgi:hypothetical protein